MQTLNVHVCVLNFASISANFYSFLLMTLSNAELQPTLARPKTEQALWFTQLSAGAINLDTPPDSCFLPQKKRRLFGLIIHIFDKLSQRIEAEVYESLAPRPSRSVWNLSQGCLSNERMEFRRKRHSSPFLRGGKVGLGAIVLLSVKRQRVGSHVIISGDFRWNGLGQCRCSVSIFTAICWDCWKEIKFVWYHLPVGGNIEACWRFDLRKCNINS